MKKLVLTLVLGVFAFAASGFDTYDNFSNNKLSISKELEIEAATDCFTVANQVSNVLARLYDLSYGNEFAVWEVIYLACLDQN